MIAGDPSPRSPAEVLRDRNYRRVESTPLANDMVRLIVFHAGTERYFETYYNLQADKLPASWCQVVPKQKIVIEYVAAS